MIFNPKHKASHHTHHTEPRTLWGKIAAILHLPGHTHSHAAIGSQDAMFRSELGVRTVKQALLLLGLTMLLQVIVYVFSNSVALLADTVHNLGDALNSIPLLFAFMLARRAATRQYTYGYGRAEDIAGLLIIVSIAFSAGYIFYEAIHKILSPQLITYGGWVVLAALIGFAGNEAVASLQIRVGKQIGSEAMIADGRHARVDGLTSLAIIPAVVGSWLGWPILDPLFGLLIAVAILFITCDAVRAMWYRLMDAVDPHLVDHAELALESADEVTQIKSLRMRWVGHSLHLVAELELASGTPFERVTSIRQQAVKALKHEVPFLDEIVLSFVPG
ncbi:MAG: cation transporter [Anaerolineales bacterium]|nr:cation transporter [Anaerolineales bacterium]